MKKNQDIANYSDQDLKKNLDDSTTNLLKLKTNHGINPLDNPMEIRILRRKVARLNTETTKRRATLIKEKQ